MKAMKTNPENQNEKYPGLSALDVEKMTPAAREAIARGLMPARMAAAVYGVRSAEAVEQLFPAAAVACIQTRVGDWPEFYYDIERYVRSWTQLDDVPAGLFGELTEAGRRWFRARLQEMIRRQMAGAEEPLDRHDTSWSLFLRLAGATGDEKFSELAAAVLLLVHEVETGQIRYHEAAQLAREHARRIEDRK